MNKIEQEETHVLDIQLLASSLFLVSLITTILLTYNQREHVLHKKGLWNEKETYIITNLNRIFILFIVLLFLYTSFETKNIAIEKGTETKLNDLDILASILTTTAAIIVLYITASANPENALSIENPNI